VAKYWWDPQSPIGMLHKMNPTRIEFIKNAIDASNNKSVNNEKPFEGMTAIDVGCGAGLLSEVWFEFVF
jgi:2-polyprenyl-6-hydroxyphenyl methylase / 3-demethylubiquinone-9 3-methyltransferase